MYFRDFNDLSAAAAERREPVRVVVAAPEDRDTLEAAVSARRTGLAEPMLVGEGGRIEGLLKEAGEEPSAYRIIDRKEAADKAAEAARMAGAGEADVIMKGLVDTSVLLGAVVSEAYGLRTGDLLSHLAFLEVPGYGRLMVLTDSGMVLYPDLEQKKGIIRNAVETLKSMGYERPSVAVLAAAEKVNPKMRETLEAAELKAFFTEPGAENCDVEGPISWDLAVSPKAAKAKGFACPWSGSFDVMVVPDITAGNIVGKALVYSAGAKMAGMVVGARVPVVLTSRGASMEEKLLSLSLCAAFAGGATHE